MCEGRKRARGVMVGGEVMEGGGGGDPTLTVVQTEHLMRAMEKERKGEKNMLVSSSVINVFISSLQLC